jgi:hypothetical protein
MSRKVRCRPCSRRSVSVARPRPPRGLRLASIANGRRSRCRRYSPKRYGRARPRPMPSPPRGSAGYGHRTPTRSGSSRRSARDRHELLRSSPTGSAASARTMASPVGKPAGSPQDRALRPATTGATSSRRLRMPIGAATTAWSFVTRLSRVRRGAEHALGRSRPQSHCTRRGSRRLIDCSVAIHRTGPMRASSRRDSAQARSERTITAGPRGPSDPRSGAGALCREASAA